MHCNLYIPDFFSAEGFSSDRLAAAETLIARGRRKRIAPISPEAWLFERFGVPKQRDWPVAPYTLLADGGAPERHYWMRADPVHLRVSRDSLGLADTFEVSRAESEALVETLNRHFGPTMLFYPMRPARWYVRFDKAPELQTTPAAAARGLAIDEKLPSGPDAMRFHALMNEAQMRSPAACPSQRESLPGRCRKMPDPRSPGWGTREWRWSSWTPLGRRSFASAAQRSSATGSGRSSPRCAPAGSACSRCTLPERIGSCRSRPYVRTCAISGGGGRRFRPMHS